jgi:hypothetical protein
MKKNRAMGVAYRAFDVGFQFPFFCYLKLISLK